MGVVDVRLALGGTSRDPFFQYLTLEVAEFGFERPKRGKQPRSSVVFDHAL